MVQSKYRRAVFIVTYKKENNNILYLILKRKLHWKGFEFPKGGIEKKESETQTVKRELKEETGNIAQNINSFPYKGKYKYHKPLSDRPNYTGQSYRLFSAEINYKKIKIDKREHSGYIWVSYKQALKILNFPNQRKCLRIVNNYIIKRDK
jgi:8-oxo-dGTP pyrophosphatase MutT (NUDIX family)